MRRTMVVNQSETFNYRLEMRERKKIRKYTYILYIYTYKKNGIKKTYGLVFIY